MDLQKGDRPTNFYYSNYEQTIVTLDVYTWYSSVLFPGSKRFNAYLILTAQQDPIKLSVLVTGYTQGDR